MGTFDLGSARDASELPDKTERGLSALWMEVLELKRPPGPTDNFFSLGGDSMAMVTLEFRIQEEFPVHMSPGTLLGAPTVRQLSIVVNALLSDKGIAVDLSD